VSAAALLAEDVAVTLPVGTTRLEEIGLQRVAYASYDGPTVEMPPAWIGHFDAVSGISYQPGERVLGTSAILLHTPWRVPAGKAWVDYRLSFPKATPIRLAFRIAMRPEVAVPGKSDGVTFGCSVLVGGKEEVLLSEHYDKGEWKPFAFDLSRFAGQTVVLRLQAEPGPARNSAFDFSYFGDAAIQAGDAVADRGAEIDRLLALKACRAADAVALPAAGNDPARGIVPPSLLPAEVSVREAGGAWFLSAVAADARIEYAYRPATGALDDLTVSIDGGASFQPAVGGGLWLMAKDGDKSVPVAARGGKLISVTREGPAAIAAEWQYDVQGTACRARWGFGIVGKALTVAVSSEAAVVDHFSLGSMGPVALRRVFPVPYMPADWSPGTVQYLPTEHLFVCRYLDWTQSNASRCPQGDAFYEPRTDGVRSPLRESGYIAVSPQVCEVLPAIPFPASPFKELLGPRLMLDVWDQHDGTFQGSAANLRDLKDNGIDHVAIINHVWQCFGYDVKLPDHIPANAGLGGDEGMRIFGTAANECGYVWSVHENYIDLYPDAPSYDATARVLRADGTPSLAWFNGGTGVQSYGLKCNRALGYAQKNSPEIHRRYGTTAGYLDVHTCVPPWHQLDHEAGQPMAAMLQAKVRADRELFQYMRDTHGGPLFGEGANHFYWAGLCDGVEAQVSGGEDHAPFLDFDLLRLHPQMVNHGMGYYERWFKGGYEHRFGRDTGTLEQIDKYRAQELAYGHAGFVGAAQVDNVQWVAREHHLVHPVQRLYGNARVTDIRYEVAGRLVPGGIALALGDTCRQRITYDSGLKLWVNWGPAPWTVEGRVLPTWGFLALGPGTEVHTSLEQGRFADFAECPEFVFADARTRIDMPYLKPATDVEPRLRELTYLGGRRFRVTYEWRVNQEIGQDYHCFVHFRNEADTRNRGIVFQQDHAPPRPTSTWRPGDVVVDGPYEIEIPEDAGDASYDLVIGLHNGPRLPLKGLENDGYIYLARLLLERTDGKVTGVNKGSLDEVTARVNAGQADFTVRLNPPGTWVDFGSIATDGAVKVNRGADRLTLFPYPRNRAFAVALDLRRLLPGVTIDPAKIRVEAGAAGSAAPMGAAPFEMVDGRVKLAVGRPGAGRYVLTW
jgi:hypothetical protein